MILVVFLVFLTTALKQGMVEAYISAAPASFRQQMVPNSVRHQFLQQRNKITTQLFSESKSFAEHQMSVDELKSELDLRDVDYDDCISKNELMERLVASRATGKASKEILSKFNEFSDEVPPDAFNDEMMSQVQAKDGTLPGGLPPEIMKALSADPEVMTMLKDKKMQDIMMAVMEGGPDGMKKYLSDPDAMLLINKLGKAINRATGGNQQP